MADRPLRIKARCSGCAARATVFEGRKGHRLHCPRCGCTAFFANLLLLERLATGDALCPHDEAWTRCKGGRSWTRWCPVCRVRLFRYAAPPEALAVPEASEGDLA